jgi:hypothetical protein
MVHGFQFFLLAAGFWFGKRNFQGLRERKETSIAHWRIKKVTRGFNTTLMPDY